MAKAAATKPARKWTIKESPGKGKGMFATQDLSRGDLIVLEKPAMIIDKWSQELKVGDVRKALKVMTPAQKERFMGMSDAGGDSQHKIVRIFQTNGLSYNKSGSAFCFAISLINHSCLPNGKWRWNATGGNYFVTATHSIPNESEILISYAGYAQYYSAAQRDALFQAIWKFSCNCQACQSETPFGRVSDLRRILLFGLEALLNSKGGRTRFENYHLALSGSNGEDLCTIKKWIPALLTEADRTFAWFLVTKLLEAEGLFNEPLANAYASASKSLQTRLTEAGVAGQRVKHLDACLQNIILWKKTGVDIIKVLWRPASQIVYMPDNRPAWYIDKCTGVYPDTTETIHATIYAEDGRTMPVTVKPEGLKFLERSNDPGSIFWKDYMTRFGHLYETKNEIGEDEDLSVLLESMLREDEKS